VIDSKSFIRWWTAIMIIFLIIIRMNSGSSKLIRNKGNFWKKSRKIFKKQKGQKKSRKTFKKQNFSAKSRRGGNPALFFIFVEWMLASNIVLVSLFYLFMNSSKRYQMQTKNYNLKEKISSVGESVLIKIFK
jgi:hypothetical protein